MVFVAVARSLAVTLHFGQLNKKIWPEYCYLNLRPDSAADKSCLVRSAIPTLPKKSFPLSFRACARKLFQNLTALKNTKESALEYYLGFRETFLNLTAKNRFISTLIVYCTARDLDFRLASSIQIRFNHQTQLRVATMLCSPAKPWAQLDFSHWPKSLIKIELSVRIGFQLV